MEEDAFFRKFILNIFLKEGEKLYICSCLLYTSDAADE